MRRSIGGIDCFAPPPGVLGTIDLASLSQQASVNASRPVGLFWTSGGVLPSEYTLIGDGDCREIAGTTAMQSAFRSLTGYRPQGDRLVNLILDCLQGGADPDGQSGPLPIVPNYDGWMEVWMAGHSRVLCERFEWGKTGSRGSNHTAKLKQLLRNQFAKLMDDAQKGKLKDSQHYRRVLDAWCDKFNLQGAEDWREFVPQGLQNDVPGRLKHETTITDAFTDTNGTALNAHTTGGGWSWDEGTDSWDIQSNQARKDSNSSGGNYAWAATDLSSSDHYSQATIVTYSDDEGVVARVDGNTSAYLGRYEDSGGKYEIYKRVSGGYTNIASGPGSWSNGNVARLTCNGSSITLYKDGVSAINVTDTAVTGTLRCGIVSNSTSGAHDSFEAADLSAGGILFTQLERSIRGLNRGMYTRW